MNNEQVHWNEKYVNRGPNLFQPDDFLVQRTYLFHPGTVLDVACGDGRHSIFLARSGFSVTGVDFSEQGLRRLETFAAQEGLKVRAHQRDLSEEGALADLEPFDNVVVVHFKPELYTFNELVKVLRRDGLLLMNSFNTRQHEEKGFPEAFCYTNGEYVAASESLELVEYLSYHDEHGYFDGYVFRKK